MRLPGGEQAIVDAAKVRDYLLSPGHPVGRAKARFFTSLGFARDRWPELQQALLRIARDGDAQLVDLTPFGQKYTVRATIEGPNGRVAVLRSTWIVLAGEEVPRFVTTFPGGGR